jgi:hypothetical protein
MHMRARLPAEPLPNTIWLMLLVATIWPLDALSGPGTVGVSGGAGTQFGNFTAG